MKQQQLTLCLPLDQTVNDFKHQLQHVVNENEWLSKESKQRNEFIGKLQVCLRRVLVVFCQNR
jgi:hypothetical protein